MRKIVIDLMLSLALLIGCSGTAGAYTANAGFFFDGVDLYTGNIYRNPTILIICQGMTEPLEYLLRPPQVDQSHYDAAVDFHFELNSTLEIVFMPSIYPDSDIAKIAAARHALFDDVTGADGLIFFDPAATTFNAQDVLVLLTANGDYFKIGNFQNSGWTIAFEVLKLDPNGGNGTVIPEPSTFALLGVGLLGLLGTFRRKLKIRKVFWVLILGGLAFSQGQPALAQTFSCSDVTEIPQSECEVLVALYDSTNGDDWKYQGNWKQTNTPCRWRGVTCESGHVTRLGAGYELRNNHLSGFIPPEIGNLTNLTMIDLMFNPLSGALPTTLTNLHLLSELAFPRSVCEPQDPNLQNWLANLTKQGTTTHQWSRSFPCDRNGFESYFGYNDTETCEGCFIWWEYEQAATNMCWAAAAANVLEWAEFSGDWGSGEDILGIFESYWENAGNLVRYAWQWWFCGDTQTKLPIKPGWTKIHTPGGGGNDSIAYFNEFYRYWGQWNALEALKEFLHWKYGVVISVYRDIRSIQYPEFGHALTAWGYEVNQTTGETTGLWVTDSLHDSNTLTLLPVQFHPDRYLWYLSGGRYPASEGWFIGGVHALQHQTAPAFKWVITANAVGEGQIMPGQATKLFPVEPGENGLRVGVVEGHEQLFTIAPFSTLQWLLVDGVDQKTQCVAANDACAYTFSSVVENHAIRAIFATTNVLHTITASAGQGGAITPAGPTLVEHGTNQTFYIKAEPGFRVMDVVIDGQSQGPALKYTLKNITADHTIQAKFTEADNKLAIVRKSCSDEQGNPIECDACHGMLFVGDQACGLGCDLVVSTFSKTQALVAQAMTNPECQNGVTVTWTTSDGQAVDAGIFDVEDDIVLNGDIGRGSSCR